jgi:hypothetical protein
MNMTNVNLNLVVDSEFGKVYEDIFSISIDKIAPSEHKQEVERNYPKLRNREIGAVFNRRSVFLNIKWGNVKGTRVLRVAITRIGSRDEEDKTLVKFDMPAEPREDGTFEQPRNYVYRALKEAKRQFSAKVGCVVCGKPDIWFKKIKTPRFPLYQVMFRELDFADTDNRVCRDCDLLVNRRNAEFNPVPELDDDGNEYDSIFSDSVSEPYTVRRDIQFDNYDFRTALDAHASNLQLGG